MPGLWLDAAALLAGDRRRVMEVLQEGLGEDRYAPCPLLREHVAAGRLGRKSGEGFHRYD